MDRRSELSCLILYLIELNNKLEMIGYPWHIFCLVGVQHIISGIFAKSLLYTLTLHLSFAYRHKDKFAEGAKRNFRVSIRLCPQRQWDPKAEETRCSIKVVEPNMIVVDTGRGHQPHSLLFDAVYDDSASQKDIYESTTGPLVGSLMQGYNACVIAYGSPCSGKSYTMLGGSLMGKQRGILSRAVEDIFNSPEASTCIVRVSFYHISNEKIFDLLDNQPSEVTRIHEGEDTVVLEGLKEVEISSPQALLQVYRRGATNRQAGASKGEFASKSHSIFNITVINTKPNFGKPRLHISNFLKTTNLASSGKARSRSAAALEVKRCFQTVPENPQEAKTLKRSLTIFGNVIFALSMAGCHHVPYRESKLTRVLRDCLGGNCRMSLIVTVSPHLSSVTETLSSLQFASRAMAIPGRPVHRSQLHCSPPQLTAQTCLPPIASGPSSLPLRSGHRQPDDPEHKAFLPHLDKQSQPFEDSCGGGHFGFPAGVKAACSMEERVGGRTSESRASRVLSACQHSYSGSLTGPLSLAQDGGGGGGGGGAVVGGGLGRERVVYPSPRRSVERLSVTTLATSSSSSSSSSSSIVSCAPVSLSAAPGPPAECPNCKRERKIREEYDKFIVQARRDRDCLNQRVAELEARLLRSGEEEEEGEAEERNEKEEEEEEEEADHQDRETEEAMEISRDNTTELPANAEEQIPVPAEIPENVEPLRGDTETQEVHSMINSNQLLQLENENNQLKGQILAMQQELEASREQQDESTGREKALNDLLHAERTQATQEVQELRAQLAQATLQQGSLGEQTRLLSELQSSRAEHETFKGDVALTVAQLQKDKEDLMSHLDEIRECYEKVKSENALLSERVETLKREVNHGLHGNSGSSHVHTVMTNTEMLVVSHHVSQQCSGAINPESTCCYSTCSAFQERAAAPPPPEKPAEEPENRSEQEPGLRKTRDTLKQLRREHSLLLDVMLVLYRREWFTREALPYVRRTLSKCGMRMDDTD
ncbi:hypothetical protein ACEWY4_020947 [Coilia grayii]|uniref:Kinesin motor domain-containing protein n=1 Tax=Coilia grayii TaxID=363190 RepID=A0ABD1J7Y0_9TELE